MIFDIVFFLKNHKKHHVSFLAPWYSLAKWFLINIDDNLSPSIITSPNNLKYLSSSNISILYDFAFFKALIVKLVAWCANSFSSLHLECPSFSGVSIPLILNDISCFNGFGKYGASMMTVSPSTTLIIL